MDFRVGSFLLRQPLPFSISAEQKPGRALAIVESRPSFFLPHVVASAVRTHPGWRLYVFGTPAVHSLLASACKNYELATRVELRDAEDMRVKDYSRLLMSPSFWDAIREEHVLVFQADCVLVRPTPAPFLGYDYVGAVCGLLDPARFVMNGGLSLRRTEAMRRAVGLLRGEYAHLLEEPEDVAFCAVMRAAGGFRLPTMEECDAFAIESRGDPDAVVGMHGTDKYYAPPALVERLLQPSPATP